MLRLLKGRQQIGYGAAPAVQASNQHQIDVPATGGFQSFLAGFPSRCPEYHLPDLQGNRLAAQGGILPHRPVLHRQSLLVIRGNAGVQAGTEHFWQFPSLAKNVVGLCLRKGPFDGHFSECHPSVAAINPFRPYGFHHTSACSNLSDNSRASRNDGSPTQPFL